MTSVAFFRGNFSADRPEWKGDADGGEDTVIALIREEVRRVMGEALGAWGSWQCRWTGGYRWFPSPPPSPGAARRGRTGSGWGQVPAKRSVRQVFCEADERSATKNECKHPLWRACRRAGLGEVGWADALGEHGFRRRRPSSLPSPADSARAKPAAALACGGVPAFVTRGAPIKAVQELLGHASIEMTMRYAQGATDARRTRSACWTWPPARGG